ncbi:phytoene desaturase family protein [Roseibacterium sp. SDUM158016]|uniref:1-hydroxycarotenoid 3,4-desaturase CrtD n=1 Tax=Roseicyclus sediminis TaxID=2980997 RepID=UPI0021CE71AA|nr:1-hydroxycarotenoid 3,4-desaturase CrtD [Roseibacterium sp. SDUM158016]MCU4652302.1 phytoene desaturase family protein [Roseibacterium sp. SDUM158016]
MPDRTKPDTSGALRPAPAPSRAVVIGAGIGGLSAALRLAHAGLAVEVVDMAPGPGGKMRTRNTVAGPADIGPTVMTMAHVFEDLFRDVGERLCDHVTLHEDRVLARHFWRDGSTLDLHADPEASAQAVRDFAGPKGEAEFRAFTAKARRLFEAFDAPVMREAQPNLGALTARVLRQPSLIPAMAPGLSLARSLSLQFTDRRLRQLFGRYATYVGGSPYLSPAILGLIWHSEASGVWAVEGGMHTLARAVHRLAETRGARFRFGAEARRIETQDGVCSAVHLADGTRIACDIVVFNGDPKALREGRLGPAPQAAVPARGVEPRSLSAFVWGFAAEPRGVTLAHHNVFFCDDPRIEFGDIAKGSMPRDATLYVCAQDRGGPTPPDGPERFEIIMNGPPGHAATDEDRRTCRTRTFETLEKMGLGFSPVPDLTHLATPADFGRDFPASDGSLYGRSPHGMMATFHRPTARTTLGGLYLCGGGTHPGAGIPMACLSGKHAAEAIVSDLASTSTSPRTATPGGMSTASRTMASAPSRSSVS